MFNDGLCILDKLQYHQEHCGYRVVDHASTSVETLSVVNFPITLF